MSGNAAIIEESYAAYTEETGDMEKADERLYLSQNPGMLDDGFEICDEDETVIYRIEGSFLGRLYRMNDAQGKNLLEMRKKLMSVAPEFSIVNAGKVCGSVRKKFKLTRPVFSGTIDGKELLVTGDLYGSEFSICLDGKVIGSVGKDSLTWGEVYAIDIINTGYRELIAAITVIIDSILTSEEE